MPPKTGHEMNLYRNTGTPTVPTWSEVGSVEDVSIPDLQMGLAELKRRDNDFTKNLKSIMQSIGIEFTLVHGLDSTTFDALVTAFFDGTPEEWFIADGDSATSGTEGLRCPCLIEQFPWDQALEDVSGHDVRLAIAYMEDSGSEVDPEWYSVT